MNQPMRPQLQKVECSLSFTWSRIIFLFLVSVAVNLAVVRNALAIAEAHDEWGASNSDTMTILWTGSFVTTQTPPLKYEYKHWGDGGAKPAAWTDVLGGAGTKPKWVPCNVSAVPCGGWNGASANNKTITTTHAKGSTSRSDWNLDFVTRVFTGSILGRPGINGNLKAIADKANLTFSSTDAHTFTRWTDPWEFNLDVGETATISVLHRFVNDPNTGQSTRALFLDDSPHGVNSESGMAFVSRSFFGSITNELGNFGPLIALQEVLVGTGMVSLALDSAVSFDGGSTEVEKLAELNAPLALDAWLLPVGDEILLDFTWSIPAASYDRTVQLGIEGLLFAEEAQSPVPEPSTGLLLGASLAVFALGRRRRIAQQRTRDKPNY